MYTNSLDFQGLALALLHNASTLLPKWLPGGKLINKEYCIGDIRGSAGDSLRINMQSGAWCDFADQEMRGGDLISLYAKINSIGNGEAAKRLASEIGYNLLPNKVELPEVAAPPPGRPTPTMIHSKFGKPTMAWPYRDENGDVMLYIARYDPVGGKKQIIPWSWSPKISRFSMKGWPPPRPLYGLELLKGNTRPVMIVEGEKSADAARTLIGHLYCVLTWCGGCAQVRQADFSPVYGRKVLLWPDADEPGLKAMEAIARELSTHSPEIKVIDPTDHRDGWDAADAINDGWTTKDFLLWAKPRVKLYDPGALVEVLPPEQDLTPPPSEEELDMQEATPSLMSLWQSMGVLVGSRSHQPIVNADNVLRMLDGYQPLHQHVWYDEFHHRLFTKGKDGKSRSWTDVDESDLLIFMQRQLGFQKLSLSLIQQVVPSYAHKHTKNEPKDWMESLKWDGENRVVEFFSRGFGAFPSLFMQSASKNFWVSLAARVYSPGCKADEMIVVEGAQGTFKSTALSIIGGEWYTQATSRPGEKDFYLGLQGKMLIEIAELSSFSKADVNQIKKDLSSSVDDVRAVFGRHHQKVKRTCIFAGTTNEQTYLNDPTGGRRFWPVRAGKVDLDYIAKHRDQLFAEAVALYKSGANWHEMPIEETLAIQEERQVTDVWQNIIERYINGRPEVTMEQVLTSDNCLHIEKGRVTTADEKRAAKCLTQLGRHSKPKRVPGEKSHRIWVQREDLAKLGTAFGGDEEVAKESGVVF